jgi:Leucine-rich repeat (LRR) protein
LRFSDLVRLAAVNTYWRELTTEAVTKFDGFERVGNWLNDTILQRFVSLESLYLPILDSISIVTDAGFSRMSNLKTLRANGRIKLSLVGLARLSTLTELNLYGNQLGDAAISGLTNLTALTASQHLTNDAIRHLTNLSRLIVENTSQITGDGIQYLTNITSLNLLSCYAQSFDGVQRLPLLTELNISQTPKFPNVILKQLSGLTALDLGFASIIDDEGMTGLVNLKSLNLRYNSRVTNAGISRLDSLTALDLSCNHVITDEAVKLLTNLIRLDVSCTSAG